MHTLFGRPVNDFSAQDRVLLSQNVPLLLGYNGCDWIWLQSNSYVYTASSGVQLVGNNFELNIPGLPNNTYNANMTVAVRNPNTNQHEEVLLSSLVPTINKYTPMGVITNANTNPPFPSSPNLGDARDITTNAGTVGGLPVTPGDLLVFSSSGWIVLQGDHYTASTGVQLVGNNIQMDIPGLSSTTLNTSMQFAVWTGTQHAKASINDIVNLVPTYTASTGVQLVGNNIQMDIPGLPNATSYSNTMTVAVRNGNTNQHEELNLTALTAIAHKPVVDFLNVTAINTLSNLSQTPAIPVILFINGIAYFEGIHFSVSGTSLTWTHTLSNGGFDIVPGDSVVASYSWL